MEDTGVALASGRKRQGTAAAATAAVATGPKSKVKGGPAAASSSVARGKGDGAASIPFGRSRGNGEAAAPILFGHGNGVASSPVPVGRGNGAATAASSGSGQGFFTSTGSSGSPISPQFGHPPAWDTAWDNNPHPPGGFLSFFNNQSQMSQNFHLVGGPSHCAPFKAPRPVDIGGSSPPLVATPTPEPDQVPIDVDSGDEVGRTEKRILWTQEEDVRLMSSWIENSTDSTTGADRGGNQYWSDVVDSYNKTTPSHRKRNAKQCKDRWHKINRWTDLFECAYVKARRVFTSGYSDQMWIDAAHKFYLEDNKEAKLGPFVLIEVWKMCRDVAKWKTYNEELKNACKRKAYHHEGLEEENDESLEEMPKRPIRQKAAKKAALAAKGKSKTLDDGGKSKESAIDVEKLDKFSKIQEEANANRIKVLELQQKLYSDKLEATRLAHLVSQDTSSMTDEEKAE